MVAGTGRGKKRRYLRKVTPGGEDKKKGGIEKAGTHFDRPTEKGGRNVKDRNVYMAKIGFSTENPDPGKGLKTITGKIIRKDATRKIEGALGKT